MKQIARVAFLRLADLASGLLVKIHRDRSWRVPILVYHQVAESGSSPGYPWRVTPESFESQMRWLAIEEYRVLSLAEFLRARQTGSVVPRSVVLTFDDGFRGVLLHAYPILQRYGFPATLFLATGYIGTSEFPWVHPWLNQQDDPEEYRPLTWEEVGSMHERTITLGSHTVTHPHLGRLSPSAMAWEVMESRRQIEGVTGSRVSYFAYPGGIGLYGDHTPETRTVLEDAGYVCALVSEIGRNGPSADPFRLRRLGVEARDSLGSFRAKVVGAYTWVRAAQYVTHRVFSDSSYY